MTELKNYRIVLGTVDEKPSKQNNNHFDHSYDLVLENDLAKNHASSFVLRGDAIDIVKSNSLFDIFKKTTSIVDVSGTKESQHISQLSIKLAEEENVSGDKFSLILSYENGCFLYHISDDETSLSLYRTNSFGLAVNVFKKFKTMDTATGKKYLYDTFWGFTALKNNKSKNVFTKIKSKLCSCLAKLK